MRGGRTEQNRAGRAGHASSAGSCLLCLRLRLDGRTRAAPERHVSAIRAAAEVGIGRCAVVARRAGGWRFAGDCARIEAAARHVRNVVACWGRRRDDADIGAGLCVHAEDRRAERRIGVGLPKVVLDELCCDRLKGCKQATRKSGREEGWEGRREDGKEGRRGGGKGGRAHIAHMCRVVGILRAWMGIGVGVQGCMSA